MLPREVFLSHASQNQETASRIREVLTAHGVPVWFSPHHLVGGQEWQIEIGEALKRCDWFLVLLTPEARDSMWVERELNFALREQKYRGKIIPLLLVPGDYDPLSWTLADFQHIDFTGDFWQGCRDLLKVWGVKWKASVRKKLERPSD